jgi:excinuclease ABC subunit C
MASEHLQNILKTLPDKPGVYQHLDKDGRILYIGKAKSLKKRVSSYFTKQHTHGRTWVMVQKIADIRTLITENELEALLLENSLIKEHQPRYNVNLKDDKTYPWIVIKKERFPRIFYTRKKINDGSEYFGPYASVKVMKAVLDLVRQVHPIRSCKLLLSQEAIQAGKYQRCLEFHIGNCKAPCEALQSEEAYMHEVALARQIITGKLGEVKRMLTERMREESEALRFEEAQKLKEKVELLDRYQARSTVVNPSITNVDVFSALVDAQFGYVNYLKVVDGAILHAHTIEFKRKLEESEAELLSLAIPELRQRFHSDSKEVLMSHELELELEGLQLHVPQRGDKKRLVELSLKNARYFRLEKLKSEQITDPDRHVERVMEQMKQDLRLKEQPRHIECFDNSNFQGTEAVSACVVFRNGKPAKSDYRHFNVKTVEGPDDFATMEEAVFRRYRRLLDEGQSLPQLILIDGGKGQLSAALKSVYKLGIQDRVAVLGIAKRLEELFFPGDPVPLYLDKRSETLRILQQLRNEAHRFGITHHRNRRSRSALQNSLEQIEGIGPQTAEKLLKTFRSVEQLRKASEEEVAEVVGLSRARKVLQYLHAQDENPS